VGSFFTAASFAPNPTHINEEIFLARTNYSFEKRQKELAKKKKKEAKKQRKIDKRNNSAGDKDNLASQED